MYQAISFTYLRFLSLLLIVVLALVSCDHVKPPASSSQDEKKRSLKEEEQAALRQTYRLWHPIDQFDLTTFRFYSSFFDDRLKFFYRTDPGLTLGNTGINLIMLYFLDDRLVKIRYHLDKDVTDHLLDSLGLGELKTRYNFRKKIYSTRTNIEKFRKHQEGKGESGNFEIIWDRNIIYSTYQVDPGPVNLYAFDTVSAEFVYVDQLKSYRRRLIEIENELKRKVSLNQ